MTPAPRSGRRRNLAQVGATLGFTLTSRAVGLFREILISIGFGLSRATDLFYQLSAVPTYITTYITGPFSTAYIAWAHREDTPPESAYLALVARWLLGIGAIVTLVFWGMASALLVARGAEPADLVAAALMAIAALALVVAGFGTAVSNARGRFVRAQGLIFSNNACFVGLLGVGALLAHGAVKLALTGAFCLGALLAAALALRALRPLDGFGLAGPHAPVAPEVRQSLRRRFLPMLGYASIETGGFIATQAIVLAMASGSGVGVASAASLAQRLCLTANGLIINPLSNIAMVHLARRAPGQRRGFVLKAVTAVVFGLVVIALCLTLARGWLPVLLGGRGRFSAENAHLLAAMIPGYALWLVAQGSSMILSRLSFVQDKARLFTAVTTSGYVLACAARLLLWRHAGFPAAIAAGAAIEFAAALAVLAMLLASPCAPRPPAAAMTGIALASDPEDQIL